MLWRGVELKMECVYMWEVKNTLFILFDSPSEIVMHCCGWNICSACVYHPHPPQKNTLLLTAQI